MMAPSLASAGLFPLVPEDIKDETLPEEVAEVEQMPNLSAAESRDRIKTAINHRYTLPA